MKIKYVLMLTALLASPAVADEVSDSLLSDAQPLVERNIGHDITNNKEASSDHRSMQRSFALNDYEKNLNDKVSDETGEKNISLSNVSFKRMGSNRTFTSEQVKNVNINMSFSIESVDINSEKNVFTATLKPIAGDYTITAYGTYSASQKVPVLTKNIAKGERITQEDVELKNYPKARIQNTDVTDINNILGKAATKGLSKDRMVSEDDIRTPILVSKNATVSAVYRSESVEVKALAVALDDGGEGDVIRLKNFDSGKIFRAVVQADGNVFIGTTVKDNSVKEVAKAPEVISPAVSNSGATTANPSSSAAADAFSNNFSN